MAKEDRAAATVMDGSALPAIDALPNHSAISKAPRAAGYRGSDFVPCPHSNYRLRTCQEAKEGGSHARSTHASLPIRVVRRHVVGRWPCTANTSWHPSAGLRVGCHREI